MTQLHVNKHRLGNGVRQPREDPCQAAGNSVAPGEQRVHKVQSPDYAEQGRLWSAWFVATGQQSMSQIWPAVSALVKLLLPNDQTYLRRTERQTNHNDGDQGLACRVHRVHMLSAVLPLGSLERVSCRRAGQAP